MKQAMAFASRASIRIPVPSVPAESGAPPRDGGTPFPVPWLPDIFYCLPSMRGARCFGVKAESHQWVNSDTSECRNRTARDSEKQTLPKYEMHPTVNSPLPCPTGFDNVRSALDIASSFVRRF